MGIFPDFLYNPLIGFFLGMVMIIMIYLMLTDKKRKLK